LYDPPSPDCQPVARIWEGTGTAGERRQAVTLSAALGRDGLEAGDLVATWAAVPCYGRLPDAKS